MKRKTKGPSIGFKHALEKLLVSRLRSMWSDNENLTSREMDMIFATVILTIEILECDIEDIRQQAKQLDADFLCETNK